MMKTQIAAGMMVLAIVWQATLLGQELPAEMPWHRSKSELSAASKASTKFNTAIYDLIMKWRSEGITDRSTHVDELVVHHASPLLEMNHQRQVHVELRTTIITTRLLAQLRAFGFSIEATTENLPVAANHQTIVGWAAVDQLEKIAQLEQIFHIRPVLPAFPQSGEVMTAGDAILRADLARQSFQVTGLGQKIGILSDGCTHLASSQASGDLPRTVEIISNRFVGDAGTALLEIAHDVAPGAQLAFADKGSSETEFANNIKSLHQAGCTIICDDILYPLEPAFEDGIIAQTINDLVTNFNVVYISSAGDLQQDHCEADFLDGDNDGWHNFATGDETMNIQLGANATITAVLQWSNQFSKARDDYDLYLYDEKLQSILASSEDTQDGDDDPVEMLAYTNSRATGITVHLCVKKYRGQPRRIALYAFGANVTPLEHTSSNGAIFGHSAAQNCLAVAAIHAGDPNTDAIENFSSRGPARIYQYDNSGDPISFVERNKPDHAAIDGVETKVGKLGFFSNPFVGTSAAAAHSAGIAALLRQAASGMSASQIASILNHQSIDIGEANFDFASGFGRVDAYQAIHYVKVDAPIISVVPDSFYVPLIRAQSEDRTLTIANLGGSPLDYTLSWRAGTIVTMDGIAHNHPSRKSSTKLSSRAEQQKWSIRSDPSPASIAPAKSRSDVILNSDAMPQKSQPATIETDRGQYERASNRTSPIDRSGEILLYEGFESGVFPPANWTKIDGPSSPGGTQPAHWTIDSQSYVFSGNYSAVCYWGTNLNEWLMTPSLDFSSIRAPSISFWWQSSYYWHVSPYDHGDLFLKISVDGGQTWQTLWTFGDIGVWDDFTWYYSIVDLSSFSGYSNVRLAFNVIASDNADIAIDEVVVAGDRVNLGWLTLNPTVGTVAPGSSQNIQLQFSSIVNGDTLGIGYYSGTIAISSNDLDDPMMLVPVKMKIYTIAEINGRLSYYADSNMAVNDATIELSGAANKTATSDSDGRYKFSDLPSGDYQVIPEKVDDFRDAITPLDASLALQYAVGMKQLTPYQKIAADVTGNKKVSAYDASYILQRVVGAISQFPIGKDWTFVPHDFAISDSNWAIAPRSRSYGGLQHSQFHQDYLGIVYGDITGNWGRIESESTLASIAIYLQDPLAQENATILVPIVMDFSSHAFSGQVKLQYDQDKYKFRSGSVSSAGDIALAAHGASDHLILAFAAGRSLYQQSLTIELLFDQRSAVIPGAADFRLTEVLIDDAPPIITTTADLSQVNLPKRWAMSQNLPNPFNAETMIHYEVPQSAMVTIEVMNLLGQRVKTLIDEMQSAGRYSIVWDGRDNQGRLAVSGIYFCKMRTTGFEAIRKMVLVR